MVRLKHRYLLAHILYPDVPDDSKPKFLKNTGDAPYTVQFHRPSSDRLDGRLLTQMIRNGVTELFGDYGSGMIASSLQVKYFSTATSTAIIRVARGHYRLVWAALTCTTRLPRPVDQPCVIEVVRVSGTIRKAEEAAIRLAQLSIQRAQWQAAGSNAAITSSISNKSQADLVGNDTSITDDIVGTRFVDSIEDDDPDLDGDSEDD